MTPTSIQRRSAALMAVGTLLSRLTGLVRTLLLLGLGATALSDAYQIGNTVPNMVFELVVGGVLSAALVPLFIALERKGTRRAIDGIHAIVTLTAVVVLFAVIVVMMFAPQILWVWYRDGPGDAEKRALGASLLRWFAPQIGIYGFITLSTAALNARNRFAAPMFAPILNNIVVIIVLLWARRVINALVPEGTASPDDKYATLRAVATDTPAKVLLGLGTTAGVIAMGAALLPALRSAGIRYRWHWEPRHPAVRELLRVSAWTVGYVMANLAALVFVQQSMPEDGDQTIYASMYGTFFQLPHGLFAVSIMTALQPELSRAYLARDRRRFRSLVNRDIRTTLAIMAPAAAGYLVLAEPVVAVVRNGRLDDRAVQDAADVLRAFAIGLPAFSIYLLLMNACKALRDTRVTFRVNVVQNAINIALAIIVLRLGWGVRGLALAFALSYVVSVFLAGRAVSVRTAGLEARRILASALRTALATAAMVGAVLATRLLLERRIGMDTPIPSNIPGATESSDVLNRVDALLIVGAGVIVGVTVYAAASRLFGVTELDGFVGAIRRRLRRR